MSDKPKKEEFNADFLIKQTSKRDRELKPYSPEAEEPSVGEAEKTANEVPPVSAPKEETRSRKNKGADYESLFFTDAQVKTRSGSVVYIRKEYHKRMMKIVRVIGENEISLFSYLDNVLKHHFDTFQDDITRLYKEKNTDDYLDQ